MSSTARLVRNHTRRRLSEMGETRSLAIVLLALGIIMVGALATPRLTARLSAVPARAGQPGLALGTTMPGRLYILSEIPRGGGAVGSIGGRITVLDRGTWKQQYTIPTGTDVDAVPSPDGTWLYVASVETPGGSGIGTDYLAALDGHNGTTRWRIPLADRVKYLGGGPSTLTLSPDGRWLYVSSYPWKNQERI